MLNTKLIDETDQLQHQQFVIMRKIEMERKRLRDLDQRIKGVVETIKSRRLTLLKQRRCPPTEVRDVAAEKRMPLLEDKLNHALSKVSVLEHENRLTKEEIDSVRGMRWSLVQTKDRAEREAASKARTLRKMQQAAQALEAHKARLGRDVEKRKLRLVHEIEAFSNAVTDMQAELQMGREGQAASMQQRRTEEAKLMIDIARAANPEEHKAPLAAHSHATVLGTDVQKLLEDSNRYFWTISKKNFELDRVALRKARLEKSIGLLEEATEVTDIETVTGMLSEAEAENFTLVQQMKDLNNEVERLQEQAKTLEQQLVDAEPVIEDTDREALRKKAELSERVSRSKSEHERSRDLHRREQDLYGSVQEAMIGLFKMIGYSKSQEVFARQVESFGLTVANVSTFLGVVEERILQIIEVYNTFVKQGTASEDPTKPTAPRLDARGGDKSSVPAPPHLPSCSDMEDMADMEGSLGGNLQQAEQPVQIAEIQQAVSQKGLRDFYPNPRLKKTPSDMTQSSTGSQGGGGRRGRGGTKGARRHSYASTAPSSRRGSRQLSQLSTTMTSTGTLPSDD